MDIKGWKYYNCAAIPTTDPNEQSDTTPIDNGNIWKIGGVLRCWQDGQRTLIADLKQIGGM